MAEKPLKFNQRLDGDISDRTCNIVYLCILVYSKVPNRATKHCFYPIVCRGVQSKEQEPQGG
eukprot:5449860-Amphidinium_carterae.1